MGTMAELLLIVGAIAVIIAAVLVPMHAVAGGLDRAAAFFLVPVPPPAGLARLAALNEQVAAAEKRDADNGRNREPPQAELVLQLRELTGSGRRRR